MLIRAKNTAAVVVVSLMATLGVTVGCQAKETKKTNTQTAAPVANAKAANTNIDANVDADIAVIKTKAIAKFGADTVRSVSPTEIVGLYEVVLGTEIIYSNRDFSYVISGMLFDEKTSRNITREKLEKLSSVPFDTLPLDKAIKVVKGNGAQRMAVFEDPYCGFCRKFERETLHDLKDVTIYYFMYPILREDSAEKAHNILCSDNPAKTRDEWFSNNTPAPMAKETCKVNMDELVALGQKLRINGTPASVLENGKRVSGAVPKSELESELKAAKEAASQK